MLILLWQLDRGKGCGGTNASTIEAGNIRMRLEDAWVSIPVGIVVERGNANSPWSEFVWRPVKVLGGLPDANPWTQLAIDVDTIIFTPDRHKSNSVARLRRMARPLTA
jgi:hypothetical protein